LEITVAGESNFEKAKKVLEEDSLHSDSKMRTLSLVTKDGMHQLKQVLSRLDEAGIDVENVSFRSPTLDDVFLTLTGHIAKQPNGETKEQEG
jgi:ABC-2 type transport system ATP-binding protein